MRHCFADLSLATRLDSDDSVLSPNLMISSTLDTCALPHKIWYRKDVSLTLLVYLDAVEGR